MDWNKSKTLKLIELWQPCECLWNPKSAEYKDRVKRRDCLRDLAEKLEVSLSDIEKKLHSLKVQFNRENTKYKKSLTSGAGTTDTFESSWFGYNYLKFLKDVNVPVPTVNTSEEIHEENDYENVQVNQNKRNTSLVQPSSAAPKRKKTSDPADDPLTILKEARDCIINKQHVKDDLKAFGDYVAAELRTIKRSRNLLILKKKIQDLIFDVKMEEENEVTLGTQQSQCNSQLTSIQYSHISPYSYNDNSSRELHQMSSPSPQYTTHSSLSSVAVSLSSPSPQYSTQLNDENTQLFDNTTQDFC